MPLLTLITQQSLDEDYLVAAERRAASDADREGAAPTSGRSRPRRTAAAMIVVFGVLVSTAAVQNRQNADVLDASRATLIEKVETQRARVARQQERAAVLQTRNTRLGNQLTQLTDDEQAVLADNRRLQVRTGFTAVVGEGVRVTVTEVPGADENQQVRDSDLALLVNGLWESGAEAIAINGQRLTAVGGIRNSGIAITINRIGIAPPYDVEAIGDRATLAADLFNTTSGLAFARTSQRYGFSYELSNETDLSLPSAPAALEQLRSVRTQTEDEVLNDPKEGDGS